jgi:hypothetical protein
MEMFELDFLLFVIYLQVKNLTYFPEPLPRKKSYPLKDGHYSSRLTSKYLFK